MPLTKAGITRLRSLREKKHREELGLFVVEGEKVVGELLAAGYPFVEVYATDQVERDLRARLESARRSVSTLIVDISAAEMERISHYPTPSPVLAVGRINRVPMPAGALASGLTLALDGIQDPGNVGTLLRIADWFACDRVLLSPDCADLFSQKVINASMGSFARVACHTAVLADVLAGAGVSVLGCDLSGDEVHALPPLRDAVVVIGSEGRGLSAPVAACLSRRVTIPRFGGAESLNAAVAAAIVCDNLRRVGGRTA
jgi:TrmH family RNA methyltransferase